MTSGNRLVAMVRSRRSPWRCAASEYQCNILAPVRDETGARGRQSSSDGGTRGGVRGALRQYRGDTVTVIISPTDEVAPFVSVVVFNAPAQCTQDHRLVPLPDRDSAPKCLNECRSGRIYLPRVIVRITRSYYWYD